MNDLSGTGLLLVCILGLAVVIGFLFLVLAYLASNNKLKLPFDKPSKVIVGAVSVALSAVVGLGAAAGLYERADKNGWFAHERSLSVEMPRGWLAGEYKACVLAGNVKAAVLTCEVGGAPHEMNVEFRGSLGPLESETASTWVCQRAADAITCRTLVSHTPDKLTGSDY